jgi:hypothetical protein
VAGATDPLAIPRLVGTDARSPGAAAVRTVSLTTMDGGGVTVPAVGKPTAVYFFSASCGTCIGGARALGVAQRSVGDAAYVMVGVDRNDRPEWVREFLAVAGHPDAAVVLDLDGRVAGAYRVTQLSTAVVLDRDGREVYRGVEPSSADLMTALRRAAEA